MKWDWTGGLGIRRSGWQRNPSVTVPLLCGALLTDCCWIFIGLLCPWHLPSQIHPSLPHILFNVLMYLHEKNHNLHVLSQKWRSNRITSNCTAFMHSCDWSVSCFYSNKSWWICTLLLGRRQQCKCRRHFLNTFLSTVIMFIYFTLISPFLSPSQ